MTSAQGPPSPLPRSYTGPQPTLQWRAVPLWPTELHCSVLTDIDSNKSRPRTTHCTGPRLYATPPPPSFAFQTPASWERRFVEQCWRRCGRDVKGQQQRTWGQRDNCPTVTELKEFPPAIGVNYEDGVLLKTQICAYTRKSPPPPLCARTGVRKSHPLLVLRHFLDTKIVPKTQPPVPWQTIAGSCTRRWGVPTNILTRPLWQPPPPPPSPARPNASTGTTRTRADSPGVSSLSGERPMGALNILRFEGCWVPKCVHGTWAAGGGGGLSPVAI